MLWTERVFGGKVVKSITAESVSGDTDLPRLTKNSFSHMILVGLQHSESFSFLLSSYHSTTSVSLFFSILSLIFGFTGWVLEGWGVIMGDIV
jgi:hypothetical protein